MEQSLHDATVTDIVPTAPVTFKIVGSGTQRGKPKLASSDGYSYVVKRELKSAWCHKSIKNRRNQAIA
ncbi:hypothetical protein DPMN_086850 [Dreissena polymorpha]|uniref:Uncharacterized protein n=1 Tax=Dreissena polymorpha TaxID=45954 RepID=A0A9D4QUY3_DREPO|nr:hypothetical protein DPMN_086850 [Dreissena polymorpha]